MYWISESAYLDEAIKYRQEVVEFCPPPDVDHIDALRMIVQKLLIRNHQVRDVGL